VRNYTPESLSAFVCRADAERFGSEADVKPLVMFWAEASILAFAAMFVRPMSASQRSGTSDV
jgi:hypothetical protein